MSTKEAFEQVLKVLEKTVENYRISKLETCAMVLENTIATIRAAYAAVEAERDNALAVARIHGDEVKELMEARDAARAQRDALRGRLTERVDELEREGKALKSRIEGARKVAILWTKEFGPRPYPAGIRVHREGFGEIDPEDWVEEVHAVPVDAAEGEPLVCNPDVRQAPQDIDESRCESLPAAIERRRREKADGGGEVVS